MTAGGRYRLPATAENEDDRPGAAVVPGIGIRSRRWLMRYLFRMPRSASLVGR